MKVLIVLAVFAATASAALIASPGVGYSSYGLGVAPVVQSGFVQPGLVQPIGYGAQYVTGLKTLQPVATKYVAPVVTKVITPVAATRLVTPIAGVRTLTPVGTYGLRSGPILSNVVAPGVYGSGIYANGIIGKKV